LRRATEVASRPKHFVDARLEGFIREGPMFSLTDKIALVTGAGSGIGAEIAAALCFAADESVMVTGSALMIGGGWSAG
jgi:3-oxoacyl-ACP reductase-like protein